MITITIEAPQCVMCGKSAIVVLDADKYDRWQKGEHIQSVWPEMSADHREVLISGTHPECWDRLFAGSEEE